MAVTTTIFGMIISHMELQYIVYMTVGLDFLSTGPNWTPLEVPGHLQGSTMLHVVLLVPSLDRSIHCCWWEVHGFNGHALKDMWVLDVDRGVWSEVSELISLVYDELHQECMLYVMCCCLHTCGYVP